MKLQKISAASGFTLIEVAVVVAVVAAVGLLALNVGAISLPRYFFYADLDVLTAEIFSTRSKAMNALLGQSHGLHFETDRYVIFVGDVYDPADLRNEVFLLYPGIILDSVGDLIFEKLSGDVVLPQTIKLKNGVFAASIVVNSSGNIEW